MPTIKIEKINKSKTFSSLEQGACFIISTPNVYQSKPNLYMKTNEVANGADDYFNCMYLETGTINVIDPLVLVIPMTTDILAKEA
jgi:hypothetical protein